MEWFRHAKFAGTKNARRNNYVALSFDDGPHFDNTPKVLEILNEHNIRSTFFWIVENATNLLEKEYCTSSPSSSSQGKSKTKKSPS